MPLNYRIGPGQTAALILVAVACFVPALYFHPSSAVRVVVVVIALAALALAAVTRWMYLVVDDEGVAVRYLGREQWLPWPEIKRVEVVSGVRGSETIRFSLADGTSVDAPPSLLQPSRPMGKPAARRRLEEIQRQIESRRVEG
ncbi:PH domain-containing protein [Actinoplanes sp. NPDC051411]|uniref:PH domain-containing protein n=1 Tax=Actinoplanes sp. NPDC051411 TaxID=3155522 RepID=UPI003422AA79